MAEPEIACVGRDRTKVVIALRVIVCRHGDVYDWFDGGRQAASGVT